VAPTRAGCGNLYQFGQESLCESSAKQMRMAVLERWRRESFGPKTSDRYEAAVLLCAHSCEDTAISGILLMLQLLFQLQSSSCAIACNYGL